MDALPELPEAWLEYLKEGASQETGPAAAPEQVAEIEAALFAREGLCPEVAGLLADADARMGAEREGARHDTMTGLAFRLAHLCAAGHLSWIQGAGHLQGLWSEHVGDGGERGQEFVRIMRTALAKVGPITSGADPCALTAGFTEPAPATEAWRPNTVEVDVPAEIERVQRVRAAGDGHNGLVLMAHRFAVENEGRLMHVPGIGWHAWDGRRWAAETGEVYRAVHVSLRTALHDAADLEEDARKRLLGAAAKVDTGTDKMLKHAQARPELTCLAGQLDADPWLLNVANGTLDLRTLELRPHDPADRITKVAAAPFLLERRHGRLVAVPGPGPA